MAYKRFVRDGYVYTQCVHRHGKLVCKADGGFFKFPLYGSRKAVAEEEKEEATRAGVATP